MTSGRSGAEKIGVQIHCDYEQGSQKWLEARCGLLTASEFDRILTPPKYTEGKLTGCKVADNVRMRAHLWEMAAQRITGWVEPQYVSDAMLRGQEDEIKARVSKAAFQKGTKEVAATLFEEFVHLRTGYADETRQLQTWLMDELLSHAEKMAGVAL